ncbi:MAG: hypothetical protein Q8M76_03635, partial [Spirochaetaceae bacterium]|nr:hypothetical protein [Spirochaetaceae bacterium]
VYKREFPGNPNFSLVFVSLSDSSCAWVNRRLSIDHEIYILKLQYSKNKSFEMTEIEGVDSSERVVPEPEGEE